MALFEIFFPEFLPAERFFTGFRTFSSKVPLVIPMISAFFGDKIYFAAFFVSVFNLQHNYITISKVLWHYAKKCNKWRYVGNYILTPRRGKPLVNRISGQNRTYCRCKAPYSVKRRNFIRLLRLADSVPVTQKTAISPTAVFLWYSLRLQLRLPTGFVLASVNRGIQRKRSLSCLSPLRSP